MVGVAESGCPIKICRHRGCRAPRKFELRVRPFQIYTETMASLTKTSRARLDKALSRNAKSHVVLKMCSPDGDGLRSMTEAEKRAAAIEALRRLGRDVYGGSHVEGCMPFFDAVLEAVVFGWRDDAACVPAPTGGKTADRPGSATPGIDGVLAMMLYVDPGCDDARVVLKRARCVSAMTVLKGLMLAGRPPPKAELYELVYLCAVSLIRLRSAAACLTMLEGDDVREHLSVDLKDLLVADDTASDDVRAIQNAVAMTWIRHVMLAGSVGSTYLACMARPDKQLPAVRRFFKSVVGKLRTDGAIIQATARYLGTFVRVVQGMRVISVDSADVRLHLVESCRGIMETDGTEEVAERLLVRMNEAAGAEVGAEAYAAAM